MNKSLKIPKLAHASLAHSVRHWTLKQVIISCIRSSPTGGNFLFAVVKFFDANTAISANFVLTVKNSNESIIQDPTIKASLRATKNIVRFGLLNFSLIPIMSTYYS